MSWGRMQYCRNNMDGIGRNRRDPAMRAARSPAGPGRTRPGSLPRPRFRKRLENLDDWSYVVGIVQGPPWWRPAGDCGNTGSEQLAVA